MSKLTRNEVIYLLKQAGNPERLNLNRRRFAPGIDLSGLDLHGAQLAGAFLPCANLSGANLSGANLKYTDLDRANLSNATLKYANLGKNLIPFFNPRKIWIFALFLLLGVLPGGCSS